MPASKAEQLLVETYYKSQRTLPPAYWLNIRRGKVTEPFAMVGSGVAVDDAISEQPYTHWGWDFMSSSQVFQVGPPGGHSCRLHVHHITCITHGLELLR
jgi:hypothetical protein